MPPPEGPGADGEGAHAHAPAQAPARDLAPWPGIQAIRGALGLGAAEERRVRAVGAELADRIPEVVDTFYAHLLTDPRAMQILDDDARVVRLKRSLQSWLRELFTLPWDEDFQRLRETVGFAHVRIQLPTEMMVTSMARMREDLTRRTLDLYDFEPEEARENANAVRLALDMELTLMLVAYRRRERAVARENDRMVYAQRAARRLTHALYDRVDAALCYLELARSDDGARASWLTKLKDVLRGLARVDRRFEVHAGLKASAARRVRLRDLCTTAIADVSLQAGTHIELEVEPPGLQACVADQAVQLAVEELLQNGARHAPGGTLRVDCRRGSDGSVQIAVTDEGPGWGEGIRDIKDIYDLGSGLGLSFCELVAESHRGSIDLFASPQGGAGVRLILAEPASPEKPA